MPTLAIHQGFNKVLILSIKGNLGIFSLHPIKKNKEKNFYLKKQKKNKLYWIQTIKKKFLKIPKKKLKKVK